MPGCSIAPESRRRRRPAGRAGLRRARVGADHRDRRGAAEATPTCPSSPCLALSRTTGYQAKAVDCRSAYSSRPTARSSRGRSGSARRTRARSRSSGQLRRGVGGADDPAPRQAAVPRVIAPVAGDGAHRSSARPCSSRSTPLDVKNGQIIALTVPTWAPALTQLLKDGSSWRASRANRCDNTETQTAQTRMQQRTQYRCRYRARLTYSATLITTPRPNKAPDDERRRAPGSAAGGGRRRGGIRTPRARSGTAAARGRAGPAATRRCPGRTARPARRSSAIASAAGIAARYGRSVIIAWRRRRRG